MATDREQELRLQAQVQTGEEAMAVLSYCQRLFPQLRAEVYRKLEADEEPDIKYLRAELMALRSVEERLTAAVRGGQVALKELTRE